MEKTEITMTGLLEILCFKTGCMYLSDLRQSERPPVIKRAVQSICPGKFSLWEWNDAVTYITGSPHSFANAGEAAGYLMAL